MYNSENPKEKHIYTKCKISLTDVYCKEKAQVTPVLKPCNVRLENIHLKVHNKLSSENNLHVLPKGLKNPQNHCYINCGLQIIHRIFNTTSTKNIRINKHTRYIYSPVNIS